jgi:hypothetical protein
MNNQYLRPPLSPYDRGNFKDCKTEINLKSFYYLPCNRGELKWGITK